VPPASLERVTYSTSTSSCQFQKRQPANRQPPTVCPAARPTCTWGRPPAWRSCAGRRRRGCLAPQSRAAWGVGGSGRGGKAEMISCCLIIAAAHRLTRSTARSAATAAPALLLPAPAAPQRKHTAPPHLHHVEVLLAAVELGHRLEVVVVQGLDVVELGGEGGRRIGLSDKSSEHEKQRRQRAASPMLHVRRRRHSPCPRPCRPPRPLHLRPQLLQVHRLRGPPSRPGSSLRAWPSCSPICDKCLLLALLQGSLWSTMMRLEARGGPGRRVSGRTTAIRSFRPGRAAKQRL
jgi:hypothetical protein